MILGNVEEKYLRVRKVWKLSNCNKSGAIVLIKLGSYLEMYTKIARHLVKRRYTVRVAILNTYNEL